MICWFQIRTIDVHVKTLKCLQLTHCRFHCRNGGAFAWAFVFICMSGIPNAVIRFTPIFVRWCSTNALASPQYQFIVCYIFPSIQSFTPSFIWGKFKFLPIFISNFCNIFYYCNTKIKFRKNIWIFFYHIKLIHVCIFLIFYQNNFLYSFYFSKFP